MVDPERSPQILSRLFELPWNVDPSTQILNFVYGLGLDDPLSSFWSNVASLRNVFRCHIQCKYAVLYKVPVVSGKGLHIPGQFVVMVRFCFLMLLQICFAFEEPAATAENRVVADVTQVVSEIIDAVQPAVTIPTGEVRDHFAGERMCEARNPWLMQIRVRKMRASGLSTRTRIVNPLKIPTIVGFKGLSSGARCFVAMWLGGKFEEVYLWFGFGFG
jgi:hypothetical protein